MQSFRQTLAAAALVLCLILLASCYTFGTEPEWVKGRFTDQARTEATLIPAPLFMEEYERLAEDPAFGRRDFRITINTRLKVDVQNDDKVSATVDVGPDGQVDLPLVGLVKVAGRHLNTVREDLAARYAPFYKDKVQVAVNTERTWHANVYGMGRIGTAGRATVVVASHSIAGSQTELHGADRLIDVLFGGTGLSGRGGLTLGDKPEWKQVGIIRKVRLDTDGSEERVVIILCDLEALLFRGDLLQNVPIRHQDLVFVPRRRDTLLEELHQSLGYWAGGLSSTQQIRDVIKAMENW